MKTGACFSLTTFLAILAPLLPVLLLVVLLEWLNTSVCVAKMEGMIAVTKILLVDDDDEVRAVLAEALLEEGYTVRLARGGREALNILKQEGGWIIVLDMMMPEVSGLEVIRHLEDNPKLAKTNKIIVMSAGWTMWQKATRPVSPLVIGRLAKPFELEELFNLLDHSD